MDAELGGFSQFGNFRGNSLKDILARGLMAFCTAKEVTREEIAIVTSAKIFDALLQELSVEDAKEASEKALELKDLPAGLVLFDVPILAWDGPGVPDKFLFMDRKGLEYAQMEGML